MSDFKKSIKMSFIALLGFSALNALILTPIDQLNKLRFIGTFYPKPSTLDNRPIV
ncbi:hypothetical protein AADEFJLK_02976 [Methylovulum psychrotolerans]|uniref:Uncharacterized protein n=1 Tax=Methylovulum psychrotolerans TaxID=1704499 RepID=A0A2S5CJN5_9GAMM|nr:hypothetical protein AADEFJLK_02976 [Methylovulum psychrotolerans]